MKIKFIQKIIDKLRGKKKKSRNKNIDASAVIDKNCKIGEHTYIGPLVRITKTSIGRYCSIAPNVLIGMGEHDIEEISTSHKLSEKNYSYEYLTRKDLEIGNDVWIGAGAVIRRGVKIGNGAVIGALSFVNKDVPDFAVVAGVPARIIKYRFDEEKRNAILASKYWEYEPEKAQKIIKEIANYR